MQPEPMFWDTIAEKYRKSSISDPTAYEATLDRVARHLHTSDTILEIGCGTGATALRLAPLVDQMIATDFSSGMIAQAQQRAPAQNVTFRVGSVFDEDLQEGKLNAVLAFNLFHLVADFRSHLERIHTLLAPGGMFISKTPCLTDPRARWTYKAMVKVIPVMQWMGKAPFVQFRTISDLHTEVTRAGFEIVETGEYPAQPPSHFIVARKL